MKINFLLFLSSSLTNLETATGKPNDEIFKNKINDGSKMYSRIIVRECFGEYAGNMNAYGIALMKKNASAIEQEFGL